MNRAMTLNVYLGLVMIQFFRLEQPLIIYDMPWSSISQQKYILKQETDKLRKLWIMNNLCTLKLFFINLFEAS